MGVNRMNNLIRRQAAIDATWFEPSYTDPFNVLTEVRDRLKALPSAQPEQRWIPCSERLPEEMGTYMTTIDYGEHGLATGQRYYYGGGLKWNDECVIAWMPLPEPYREERTGCM